MINSENRAEQPPSSLERLQVLADRLLMEVDVNEFGGRVYLGENVAIAYDIPRTSRRDDAPFEYAIEIERPEGASYYSDPVSGDSKTAQSSLEISFDQSLVIRHSRIVFPTVDVNINIPKANRPAFAGLVLADLEREIAALPERTVLEEPE